jgi:hypothetical protein
MRLKRSGARRFHGWTTIFNEKLPKVRWNGKRNALVIRVPRAMDPYWGSVSSFDYELTMGMKDVAALLAHLASDKASHPAIAGRLKVLAPELVKLLAITHGVSTGAAPRIRTRA